MVYIPSDAQTALVFNGTLPVTPRVDVAFAGAAEAIVRFAKIDAPTNTTTELVAAVSGSKIRVLRYHINATYTGGGAITEARLQWRSAATALSGRIFLLNNQHLTESHDQGLFETASGEALNINLNVNSADVVGTLTYVLIPV